MALTLRESKGAPLTHAEMDTNLRHISALKDSFLSVADPTFGAVGDTSDETSKLQAALNTGKDVFVPRGTGAYYKITSELTFFANNQKLYFENGAQIRQFTDDLNVIKGSSKTGCVLQGGHLYAVGTIDSLLTGGGVLFDGCTRVKVLDCVIENHRGGGVILNNTNDSVVRGNTFINSPVDDLEENSESVGDIVLLRSSSRNIVSGNVCKSGNGIGVYVQSLDSGNTCNDNVISGNDIQDCKAYGVMLYRQASDDTESVKGNAIVGNTIRNTTGTIENSATGLYDFGAGVYVQGAEDTTVVGNTIIGTHQGAVTFGETLAPGAIGCINVTRFNVSNNVIQDAGWHGIHLGLNSVGATVGFGVCRGNVITNCVKAGIKVNQRGRLVIDGNAIDTTASNGIWIGNTSLFEHINVTNNAVRNTTSTANILMSFADGAVVSGNNCDTSSTHGISVGDSVAVMVTGNVVKNHTSRGIQIVSTSSQCSVLDNYVEGNGSSSEGITLSAATRYADNDVSGCVSNYTGTFAPYQTLSVNDATPSVKDGKEFVTNNSSSTTITAFDDGYEGQEIVVVIADANTTLDFTSSNLKGNNGVDRLMASGDVIRATFRASVGAWYVTINPISGTEGYSVQSSSALFSPTDALTYYQGVAAAVPSTTEGLTKLRFPVAGTIVAAQIDVGVAGTLGTTEQATMSFRLNATTDTTLSSVVQFNAANQGYTVTGLNIAVATTDTAQIKTVMPTFSTNPTNVVISVTLFIRTVN